MKVHIFSLLLIILLSFSTIPQNSYSYNSDYGTGKSLLKDRKSSLREYRIKNYRKLPKWWHKYPHKKANFIWVSYRKNKKLVKTTYRAVMNHPRYRGANDYNKALKFYRLGAKYVNKGNFKYAIGYSHLARRRLYIALARSGNAHKLPGRYRRRIPGTREFKRIEYKVDSIANEKDMEARRERARKRLMGGKDSGEPVDIELDKDTREIK